MMLQAYNQGRVTREPGSRPGTYIFHVHNGNYYTINNFSDNTIYFRCHHRSCNGRAILCLGQGFMETQPHNHVPDPLFHQVQSARRNIVNRAASITYVSFTEILEEEKRRIQNRAIRLQLTKRRLRSAMQRARSLIFPDLPDSLFDLAQILMDPAWRHLTSTLDLEDNLFSAGVPATDGSFSLVFISERSINLLRDAQIIFLDGTFKITPARIRCYQVIPLMWCLMERKSQSAYTAVLVYLRSRLIDWQFNLAVCDYEDAIINSVEIVFGIEVQGCYFHYVHALGSWARSNITVYVLTQYPEVINVVRHCSALPLLPQHLLQRGLNVIGREALDMGPFLYGLVRSFLVHVQENWLWHVNRGRTLSVCGSENRTNNASESNNHRMNTHLQVTHPNIFRLMRSFVLFEDVTMDDVLSLQLGIIPNRHRASSSVSNDENIQRLTALFLRNPNPTDAMIAEFLHAAAFQMDNVAYEAMGFQRRANNANPE